MKTTTIILLGLSLLSMIQLIAYHGFSAFFEHFLDRRYFGLFHNLLLAWIPYLICLLFGYLSQTSLMTVATLFVWLLFLPNAPYLVTDLIYVHENENITGQQSVLMYASFSITGLLLFWSSINHLQITMPYFQDNRLVIVIIALSAIGVWTGRMLRWQSWDIIRPEKLISDLKNVEILSAMGWIGVLFFLLWLPYQLFTFNQ